MSSGPSSSVSQGCFVFKNNDKHIKRQKKTKSRLPKYTSIIDNDIANDGWYTTYKSVWEQLESEIKSIQNEDILGITTELLQFVAKNGTSNSNLLPTAVLLTGINQTDHYNQFEMLSQTLIDQNYADVTILQSRDCLNLKSAFQKLVSNFIESSDDSENMAQKCLKRSEYTMKTLESWWKNKKNPNQSLVVILPDFELFNMDIFRNIIIVLSSYRTILPIIMIIGVATTLTTLQNALPHRIINNMEVQVFLVEPSTNNLNKIIENVLFSPFCPIHLSGKAFELLIDIFLLYDFSVNSFINSFKFCLMEHYSNGNIFSLCNFDVNLEELIDEFETKELEEIRQLPSCRNYLNVASPEIVIGFLSCDDFLKCQVKNFVYENHEYWHKFLCGIKILNILQQNLPENLFGKHIRHVYSLCLSKSLHDLPEYKKLWSLLSVHSKSEYLTKLSNIIELLRNYNLAVNNTANRVVKILDDVSGIISRLDYFVKKIKDASTNVQIENISKNDNAPINSRGELRDQLKATKKQHSEFAELITKCTQCLNSIISDYIKPITDAPPLTELFTFNDTYSIKGHIVGMPRGAVHTALVNPNIYLNCECCKGYDASTIAASFPDISIIYKLHLECGKLINIFDWMQAFRAIVDPEADEDVIEDTIQARFTRGVSELEFLGFIKSTKKKTDHVLRLTW